MVEKSNLRIAIQRRHVNKDSRINIKTNYYECILCFQVPSNCRIVECVSCKGQACEKCILDHTRKKVERKQLPEDFLQKQKLNCPVACQNNQAASFRSPNKLMMQALEKVVMFDCNLCLKAWLLRDFVSHKQKGLCVKDPEATNSI